MRAVDCFTDYYDPSRKRMNLAAVSESPRFELIEADLADCDVEVLFEGVEAVVHEAGQPGVRASWADFDTYLVRNVEVTRKLLDAATKAGVSRFVYASSSSVYGAAATFPTREDTVPQPLSPYGVSKLAAEHLCGVWAREWGLPTVSLRYFTVYGPRQRPDMAIHRLCKAAIDGSPFPMYGDGSQVRDVTEVSDVVEATLAALTQPDVEPGSVMNVAGGSQVSLAELIDKVSELAGERVRVERLSPAKGDPPRTGGETGRARSVLGWEPRVGIDEGLARQFEWHLQTTRRES